MTALTLEQVTNMSLPQTHTEIKARWDLLGEIDKKYPNGLTRDDSAEDFDYSKELLGEVDLLESRAAALEDATARSARIQRGRQAANTPAERHHQPGGDDGGPPDGGARRRGKSFGQMFVENEQYRELVTRGAWADPYPKVALSVGAPSGRSLIRELKALVTGLSDTSGGAFILPDRQSYVPLLYPELSLLDLLPVVPTTSDLVDWVREVSFTNNAAPTAEATAATGTSGEKPESAVAFEVVSQPVQSIPHWIPVTTRAIADAPQLRAIIEGELLAGLQRVLEDQCLNGNGTPPNLGGIIGTTGVQTTAAGANLADAFFTAQTLVRTNGHVSPTANVMDAAAWSALRLARENAATGTQGGYLFGSPAMAGPITLWGLPVVLNEALPANQGLVGDFTMQSITLYEREGGAITTGWIDRQFVRNMVTILAELRACLAVKRPPSFCKVTGLP